MSDPLTRREFARVVPALGTFIIGMPPLVFGQDLSWPPPRRTGDPPGPAFPSHDPALAKEMVGVAHADLARVRELVGSQPALARASWDWGFGDWETALGAASHTGQRAIAEILIGAGAPATIFSAAMLGQLEVVKAFLAASPGMQRAHGPHGITLLAHARVGGPSAEAVLRHLEAAGEADARLVQQPLEPTDRAAIEGLYEFGTGARDRFEVDTRQNQLGIVRLGATRRSLVHRGGLEFSPIGAPAVRVRFVREGSRVVHLTVSDPDLVVTARPVSR